MFDQYLAVIDLLEEMLNNVVKSVLKPVLVEELVTKPRASSYWRPLVKVRGIPLNCDVCNEPFQAGRELMRHMHKIHKAKLHEVKDCDYCVMEFRTTDELMAHVELDQTLNKIKEKSETIYKCKSCLQIFSSKGELKIHKKRVHYKCKYCDFLTVSTKLMGEHLVNNHTERNLTNNANKHPEPEAKNWQAGALLKPNTTHCLSLC